MIPPQLPPNAHRIPMLWSEPRMHPSSAVSASDMRLRRRTRGGLIVDLDDTLYPREHFVLSGFAAVARHVARTHDLSSDAAFATMSRAHRAAAERGRELQALCAAHHLPTAIIPELVGVFREHRPSLWLSSGVVDALQALRRQGWRIAVLTNGLPSVQASKVAALDLARYVDHVLYAESYVPGGKPASAVFHAAVVRLGLPAEWCICVGDDPVNDIQGAQRVGLRAVQLRRPGVPLRPEADAIIDTFEDLPATAASLLDLVNIDVA